MTVSVWFLLPLESNPALGLLFRERHQGADGFKHDLELGIILFLHFIQFAGQIFMRRQDFTQFDEGSHDGDVYLNGSAAAQNAREHCDTLFGEGVGQVLHIFATCQGHNL